MKKEIELHLLGRVYPNIGIDKPSNHDEIVEFIVNDVKESASAEHCQSGDIAIGFRRFIENK
jgi:hypothetical protein